MKKKQGAKVLLEGEPGSIYNRKGRQKGAATSMKAKKVLHGFLAAAAAVSLILILLLSAFEIATYSDFGFYQKEYEKYAEKEKQKIVKLQEKADKVWERWAE